MNDWRKDLNDTRNTIAMVCILIIAPKLPEYVAEIAAGLAIAIMIFMRESVVDGLSNLWRFITMQNP